MDHTLTEFPSSLLENIAHEQMLFFEGDQRLMENSGCP